MKLDQIIAKIKSIRSGRFFRVRYITKVKMNAESVKQGITIFKIVDMTTRTGVKYSNIRSVAASCKSGGTDTPQATNWEWRIPDRIKHNSATNKDYLVIAPIKKGANAITTYIMTDSKGNTSIINKETAQKYTVPSYWQDDKPDIMTISLDNVLSIK